MGALALLAPLIGLGCGAESPFPTPPGANSSESVASFTDFSAPETDRLVIPPQSNHSGPTLIVLISIDTLRPDHLGLYGHSRFTSPMLDLFAREGTVFEDASSVAPWTLPAHASMLTGLYPLEHGVIDPEKRLGDEIPTLAKLLGDKGWQTAAAVNSSWLLKKNHELARDFDLFYFVESVADQRLPTRSITDRAMQWIRDSGESKMFVFMHYYDVHSDYLSLPKYENLLVSPYDGRVDGSTWQLNLASLPEAYIEGCQIDPDEKRCRFGAGPTSHLVDASVTKLEFAEKDLQHLEELYDAGIRQLDDELGRFFAFLQNTGRIENARIVITSDHGEEFLEHGRAYHFQTTYQEVLRVPLIFRGGGIPAGRRILSPVSIVDIVPTTLSWAGLDIPTRIDGLDLTPLLGTSLDDDESRMLQQRLKTRYQYGEAAGGNLWAKKVEGMFPIFHSVRQGDYKLVTQSGDQEAVLYNLKFDPGELRDIAHAEPSIAETLKKELARRVAGFKLDARPENRIELDPEELERLRALGYAVGE
jgi:arylsulfatase A-like enzyme